MTFVYHGYECNVEEGKACRMRDTKEKRKKIVLIGVYKVKKK